jgi:Rieske Fe-S protein
LLRKIVELEVSDADKNTIKIITLTRKGGHLKPRKRTEETIQRIVNTATQQFVVFNQTFSTICYHTNCEHREMAIEANH